jgi:hypothetical protein
MSYQEKRTIVTVLTGILILAAYCIYAFGKVSAGTESVGDLKFWAFTMLLFIGIGVVAIIIIQIVFHILLSIGIAIKEQIQNGSVNDDEIEKNLELEMVEDEMDKLIELKSMRFGFVVAGFGFVAGLVALLIDYSPAVMMNIIFISFNVGSILEGIAQIYYYRKGVNHG